MDLRGLLEIVKIIVTLGFETRVSVLSDDRLLDGFKIAWINVGPGSSDDWLEELSYHLVRVVINSVDLGLIISIIRLIVLTKQDVKIKKEGVKLLALAFKGDDLNRLSDFVD